MLRFSRIETKNILSLKGKAKNVVSLTTIKASLPKRM
jgi:hypothetical protein